MPPFVQPDGRAHAVLVACRRSSDGRWLMIRRAAGGPMPGRVGFPSGGVKAGESQERAIVRKMRDELTADVEPIRCVWDVRKSIGGERLTLFGWLARLRDEAIAPDPTQIAEVLWLTSAEAAAHPGAFPTIASLVAALDRPASS